MALWQKYFKIVLKITTLKSVLLKDIKIEEKYLLLILPYLVNKLTLPDIVPKS